MRSIAGWCARHGRMTLGLWIGGLIVIAVIASSVGSGYKNSFSLNGTQSFEAQQLLQKAAPKAAGDREQIVFGVTRGSVTSPATKARVNATLNRVAKLPDVASITSPYSKAGAAQVSHSGKVAFATVTMTRLAQSFSTGQATQFVNTARAGAGHGLQVEVGGAVAEQANPLKDTSVGIGALAALLVLVVVFGSLVAAILPLISAGVALGVGISLVGLLSHVVTMANFSSQLSMLIGLGVGVDYALFIVSRHRQGLLAGKSAVESAQDAIDTSGRAVLFAGMTVCIALLGMFALGVSFLYGVAISAAIVVSFTVLAALTLLPALLGMLGTRVLGRGGRRQLAAGPTFPHLNNTGFWFRWTSVLSKRPAPIAVIAVVVMAVVALPFFSLRLGSADAGSDPSGSTTRAAYELLAKGFGAGYNGPLQVVAEVNGPAQEKAFNAVLARVSHTKDVARVTPAVLLPGHAGSGTVAFANAYPVSSPQAVSTTNLLTNLRDHVVPGSTAGTGLNVLIGGQTAIYADFSSVLSSKLPFFIGIVVLLSFLLLAAVFRSIVIPLMAAAMNMLSAGAAFGVLVAVFQRGWGGSIIGLPETGPIQPFIPVMLFAILFGLSMDYEVFLVSRIYEEWHHTRDNRLAVTRGLRETGRTISAAALIMILVFASFILGGLVTIKMFGVGLAAAILLDALVIRMALVPALMLLLGTANWKLPRLLDRILPSLNVEGSVERPEHLTRPHRVGGSPSPSPEGATS